MMEATRVPMTEARRSVAVDFESFFEFEYPRIVGAMYLVTGRAAEAEEVAQEALARVFERWERVQEMASPGAYAYRVAVNVYRRRVRRDRIFLRAVGTVSPGSDVAESVAERSALLQGIGVLPRGQREALVLIGFLELSVEEAAQVLGIGPGSLRSRLSRARASLRGQLQSEDHHE